MKKETYMLRQSEVIFPEGETRYSFGRNGSVNTSAIVFVRWDDTVEVGFRTSKGKIASGHINFPYSQIDKVITALQQLKSKHQNQQ